MKKQGENVENILAFFGGGAGGIAVIFYNFFYRLA